MKVCFIPVELAQLIPIVKPPWYRPFRRHDYNKAMRAIEKAFMARYGELLEKFFPEVEYTGLQAVFEEGGPTWEDLKGYHRH